MIEHLPKLEAWHDFYVMVGSGAAALTGLLFVIVSLGPHVMARHTQTGVKAFISPIAVHFTWALATSALMLVPDFPLPALGTLLAIAGLAGLVYMGWTRAHQQWRLGGLPMLDWIWFVGLPFLAFFVILCSGMGIGIGATLGLHGIAAATGLL